MKPNDDVTERFNRAAAEWDANPARLALAKAVAEAILRAVPLRAGMRIVDYGAGTGLVTLRLAAAGMRVVAVDTAPGMLEVLQRKLKDARVAGVTTSLWNLEEAAYPETGFDAVVSSMTLHHVGDVPPVLRRCHDMLRPGGWAVLADLDKEDGSFHSDPTGVRHHGFDRTVLAGWMEAAGFTRVAVTEVYRMERNGADGRARAYGILLASGRKAD